MATRVKRVTVGAGRAVHVDHRARLPDYVDGLHNLPRRFVWRFDSRFRGGGQNGTRPVQILRDDGRADIRRPWHDRHWAGPAAAASAHWQAMTVTSRAFDFGHDEDCTPMHGYAATREGCARKRRPARSRGATGHKRRRWRTRTLRSGGSAGPEG